MTEIRVIKTLNGFAPATEGDHDLCKAWKLGDTVVFKARKPRNGKHHRLMFALIQMVMDNMPERLEQQFPNREALLTELKFQVGHCDEHRTLGDKVTYIPRSIAFDAMDQASFRVFFDDVIEVVIKYFLPTLTSDDIKDEIMNTVQGGGL